VDASLTLVIVGASGDLAQRKIIPALFALFCQGLLPRDFSVIGFARRDMTAEEFRRRVAQNLTCRCASDEDCEEHVSQFLSRCDYVAGRYESTDSFLDLYACMRDREAGSAINRVFYMAIPPFLFLPVVQSLGNAGLVNCDPGPGWSRVVIEKPFGRDRSSSDALVRDMAQVFTEEQTFRIDHYLGKEVVQNLLVLRFANRIFAPIWDSSCIRSVEISWCEDIGVGERGGYFDSYGIIRDVMQNHLLQILALIAMEEPASLHARDIRDEKVRVLRAVAPLRGADLMLGQYGRGGTQAAYVDEDSVPDGSLTPTFAAAVLHVHTPRWEGVPFLMRAGKGLDSRATEIRIRYRPLEHDIFAHGVQAAPANELTIRVQPDEAISLRIVSKIPGLEMELVETDLNLHYESAFRRLIPEAYESLLLDVVRGEKGLFIRADELAAAWDVFTPALDEIERHARPPTLYAFGSSGPAAAAELLPKEGSPC
jgi:glucose-6-phosphate 1-dehydrogenase